MKQRPTRLVIEVVTPLIGSFRHCARCELLFAEAGVSQQVHAADMASFPPEWQAEWQRLSAWIMRLARLVGPKARILMTDARSPRGFWLWLRGVRRYPAFVVGKARLQAPADEAALWAWLRRVGVPLAPTGPLGPTPGARP